MQFWIKQEHLQRRVPGYSDGHPRRDLANEAEPFPLQPTF